MRRLLINLTSWVLTRRAMIDRMNEAKADRDKAMREAALAYDADLEMAAAHCDQRGAHEMARIIRALKEHQDA